MNDYDYVVADSRNLVRVYSERRFPKADLVLTSPPYYDTKSYGDNSSQIGCNQDYSDYVADTASVLRQCFEVTNDDASLWLVMDTVHRDRKLYPLPSTSMRVFREKCDMPVTRQPPGCCEMSLSGIGLRICRGTRRGA